MPASRNDSVKNQEEIRTLCAEIINRIKTQEDPIALNEFRALVKKNVPFFMRSYFSAFLLKQLYEAAPRDARKPLNEKKRRSEPRSDRGEGRGENRTEARPARDPASLSRKEESPRREEAPRRSLPEAEAATLFIGVGRNRRAYARELLSFITGNAEVDADVVGELRVLDNFSFVQVRKECAQQIIDSLNGKEYRGRAVSVSFAKPRKEEPKLSSSADSAAEPASPALSENDLSERDAAAEFDDSESAEDVGESAVGVGSEESVESEEADKPAQ